MTADALDRETRPSHVVHVRCHDNGRPAMTSRATLNVVVDDVNDNRPAFAQQRYAGMSRDGPARRAGLTLLADLLNIDEYMC